METLNVQPPSIDWLVYRNDTTELTVVLTDNDGNAIDLTDWMFLSQVREYPTDPTELLEIPIVKNENTLTLYLQNQELPLISYFDIRGFNAQAEQLSTILRGQIIVEEDVSR